MSEGPPKDAGMRTWPFWLRIKCWRNPLAGGRCDGFRASKSWHGGALGSESPLGQAVNLICIAVHRHQASRVSNARKVPENGESGHLFCKGDPLKCWRPPPKCWDGPKKLQIRQKKMQSRPKKMQSRQKKKVATCKRWNVLRKSVIFPSEKGEFAGWSMVTQFPVSNWAKNRVITRQNRADNLAKSRYQFWPNRVINFDQNVVKTQWKTTILNKNSRYQFWPNRVINFGKIALSIAAKSGSPCGQIAFTKSQNRVFNQVKLCPYKCKNMAIPMKKHGHDKSKKFGQFSQIGKKNVGWAQKNVGGHPKKCGHALPKCRKTLPKMRGCGPPFGCG